MATAAPGSATRVVTSTPDPPPTHVPNPVHGDEGANAAGYERALVAGVRIYGWVADVVAAVAGPGWADGGWADVTLRRPLFAGEPVTITVAPGGDGWSVQATAPSSSGDGARVILDGGVGLGRAAWFDEIDPPPPSPALGPPEVRGTYTVASAPRRQPLRPLGAYVTAAAARRAATDELGLERSDLPEGRVHPWFLASRMAPLTRHNFTYGPTVHVRTQIQHRAPALADRRYVIGAQIVDAYERNGHWYQVLDGSISQSPGDAPGPGPGDEVARLRHHTIFRPRGTELPPPTRPAA